MRSKVITILISKTPSNHTLAQDLLLVATPYVKSPVNNLEGTRTVWTFWSLVKVGRIHIHRPRHITIYCLHLMFSWTCFCVYFIYYLFENRVFFHTIFLTTVTPPPTPSRSSPSPLHHLLSLLLLSDKRSIPGDNNQTQYHNIKNPKWNNTSTNKTV